jgi:hypothetical protein
MADNIGGLKDNAIVPVPPFLSSVPSRLSSRCTGGRISIPIWEMANMQREESKHEKLEREQREREQMREAIAAYSGPVTRIPPGKTTWGWLRSAKQRPGWRMWKANGR